MPLQGALYHQLAARIAQQHSGLAGPQNVETSTYAPMVGQAFQKPASGSTTLTTIASMHPYK